MEVKPENIFLYVIALFILVMGAIFVFWTPLERALTYLNVAQTSNSATSTETVQNEYAKRATVAYTQTRVQQGNQFVTLVSYDGTNFYPPVITIKRGENVRFINKGNLTMRIVSNTFNKTPIYGGFTQANSVGKGGTYELSIPDAGIWGYHNLNGNPGVIGIINVE
ncbi:MAG: hypothetical protein V4449_03825 [Patescibacteria group bacterium]